MRTKRIWLAPLILLLATAFATPCAIMLGYDFTGLIDHERPVRLAYAFDEGPEWLTADAYLYHADLWVCCTRASSRAGFAYRLGYEIDDELIGFSPNADRL